MAFAKPRYSRGEVNKAGQILAAPEGNTSETQEWANDVLANWRACHGYPINTFQATLRMRLSSIDPEAIVAQRLKRAPSIISKLQRFEKMQLARMQDIGGLRAVVGSMRQLTRLEKTYRMATFAHELISSKDYVNDPKLDGYRSIHLIYRYKNINAPHYDGLSIELQLRTRLQHAWATAVETMGTFLGQALKSGMGEREWRQFFAVAGAALAITERTAPVPGFEKLMDIEVFDKVAESEKKLHVLEKLEGFAIAADKIMKGRGQGAYHLIVLNSEERTVSIRPFPKARLDDANREYAEVEKRTKDGEQIEAVLVSAGPVDALRKAYPNYFLDTQEFVRRIKSVIRSGSSAQRHSSRINRVNRINRLKRL